MTVNLQTISSVSLTAELERRAAQSERDKQRLAAGIGPATPLSAEQKRQQRILATLQIASAKNRPDHLPANRTVDAKRWPYASKKKINSNLTASLRMLIIMLDPWCCWCGSEPSTTVDHVRPLNRGGNNHLLNLVGACLDCNTLKADFMPKELGWTLRLPQRAFHPFVMKLVLDKWVSQ